MGIAKNGYYTLRDILGYNCKVNVVLSDRGRGKTYDAKHMLINSESRSMCLFLDSEDMEKAMESWTDPLTESGEFAPERFTWEGTRNTPTLCLDGEPKIYFRYITAVKHIKHEHFNQTEPDKIITWIWIDEFITPTTSKMRGVKSAGDAIRMIMKTCDHDTTHPRESRGLKPLRLLMIGNPFTWNDANGLLAYFHIVPKKFGIQRMDTDIVLELLEPDNTKSGKRSLDDVLGDEVNKNMSFLKEMTLVEPVPKSSVPDISIRLGTLFFALYRAPNRENWLKGVPKHVNVKEGRTFGSMDGLQEGEICIEGTEVLKHLWKATYNSDVHFDTINTKFTWLNALNEFK